MSKMFIPRSLLFTAIFSVSAIFFGDVQACKPGSSLDIFFERNSAIISNVQKSKLAQWTAELLEKYPQHDSLLIVAYAEKGEIDADQLALSRELSVRLALIDMNFIKVTVDTYGKVFVQPQESLGSSGKNYSQSVGMDFVPGCPHECSCQLGWKSKEN